MSPWGMQVARAQVSCEGRQMALVAQNAAMSRCGGPRLNVPFEWLTRGPKGSIR